MSGVGVRPGAVVFAVVACVVLSPGTTVAQENEAGGELLLLATNRTGTMSDELRDAAARGYRVLARTVTTKLDTSLLGGNRYELLTIMERAPSPGPAMQYRLLATSRTGTLQDELRAAQADGWELVTLIVRSEVAAVLEKPRPGD
jgi:hypothetical protein